MPELPRWLVIDDGDTPPPPDPQVHRRTRRTALVGLGIVAVLIAATLALVAVFVDTSARPPETPRAAAQVWVNTIVHRNDAHRVRFECATGSPSLGTVRSVARLGTHITAQAARPTGPQQWRVPLRIDDKKGQELATITVRVIRHAGAYLVC